MNDENNKLMIENLGKEMGIDFGNENVLKEIENSIIFRSIYHFLTKKKE